MTPRPKCPKCNTPMVKGYWRRGGQSKPFKPNGNHKCPKCGHTVVALSREGGAE